MTKLKNGNKQHKLTKADLIKGGKKSQEAQRKKRKLQEIANIILSAPLTDDEERVVEKFLGEIDPEATKGFLMILKQFQKAMKGDTRSAEFIRDTAGQKPKDELQIDSEPVVIVNDLLKNED